MTQDLVPYQKQHTQRILPTKYYTPTNLVAYLDLANPNRAIICRCQVTMNS